MSVSAVRNWNDCIGEKLAAGNYATVYRVKDRPDLVAKVWDKKDKNCEEACLTAWKLQREVGPFFPKIEEQLVLTDPSGKKRTVLLMQYAGEDLDKKLEGGPLSIREIHRISVQVLEGLAAMHAKGWVHLDIKPANLTEQGMILDCDYAYQLSRQREFVGAAMYASPEILQSKNYGVQTDMWSFGSTLYEMLTQKPAWKDKEAGNLCAYYRLAVIKINLDELCKNTPELTPFADLVLKMLKLEPKERISAQAALEILRAPEERQAS